MSGSPHPSSSSSPWRCSPPSRSVRCSTSLGRWTLRRGRIGPAVAAFYLARRPAASARLLAVLVLVFGTLGFAAIATDVAAQGRQAEAQQLLGAPRVLEVRSINREALLKAVRTADPDGKYAMAVVPAYRSTGDNPPLLAVDSTRLSHVAYWPERYGATSAAQAAELLRPPAREPTTLGDGELVANMWPDAVTTEKSLRVALQLVSADGDRVIASFGPLTRTQSTYRAVVSGCDGQCRLTGITARSTDDDVVQFVLTFGSLRQGDREVLSAEQLADESRWRAPEGSRSVEQLWANATLTASGSRSRPHGSTRSTSCWPSTFRTRSRPSPPGRSGASCCPTSTSSRSGSTPRRR